MNERSHVDIDKLDKMPEGHYFEYRDVVEPDFPRSKRAEDGALFNSEVEAGVYDNISISNEDALRVKYKKVPKDKT